MSAPPYTGGHRAAVTAGVEQADLGGIVATTSFAGAVAAMPVDLHHDRL
jgi:hypothetical protein